ncbi:hypothetical protein PUW79_04290 [Microbacterium sp. NE2HP2]|uniref:hypothetical protein n=1 Tax=Microbacterium TaxID=33882 RepID=UPI000DF83677|nr:MULTISPECIES: hypothetical protein [Microbacterium]MCZ4066233.1 hypothetical protein [Microbacterium sp. H37-C3]MDD7943841.1 hypothetical protein [Microbacterium plantarum]MDF2917138.1 hypothetical protein [Microbacterium sp.]WHE34815.1 hypothetical protein P6897_08810 [Microbacterium sp. BDGP8]
MQIVLALIMGAAIGLAAEFAIRGREARGAALAPVLGAVIGGVAWAVMTWAGLAVDNPVIWVVAIVTPAVLVPAVLLLLTRSRARTDAAERRRLRIG